MFTGIIEETGTISDIRKTGQSIRIGIRTNITFSDLKPGDSLCVNGVCLTVTEMLNNKTVFADVTPETYSRTNFSELMIGNSVNLERAMSANGRFGGHIVTGHIDGTAVTKKIEKRGNSIEYYFSCNENLMSSFVEKGSVTINGISLTIARITNDSFVVSVIPHTMKNTNLQFLKEKKSVNIECDILGKYIQKYLENNKRK